MVYADSSFVVSLYITDAHSADARSRVSEARSFLFAALHRAESAHALSQHQFRGNLSSAQAAQIAARFTSDQASGLWREIALPENAFDLCVELARRHGARLGIRTLDSLHVACALELNAERFWTFDERQAKLAKAEGLKIA